MMLSKQVIYDVVYNTLYSKYGDDFIVLKRDLTFEELAEQIASKLVVKQSEVAAGRERK